MTHKKTSSPMQAQPASAAASRVARSSRTARKLRLPSGATPEEFLELLRRLIADDQIGEARRQLVEAVRRFPGNPEIRLAQRVLGEGETSPNPFVQSTAGAEIEWLREPPPEARGKWIALIGSQLVGMADSADELMSSLRSERFEQLPVVQYVAP